MSSCLIPTPEQFRAFSEFAFEELPAASVIFYSCCKDCGVEHLQEDPPTDGPFFFMFATMSDLEHAQKTGELYFHFGKSDGEELKATNLVGNLMVDSLVSQGFEVQWTGDAKHRFSVSVDRLSYGNLLKEMQKEAKDHAAIPARAEYLALEEYPSYGIAVWQGKVDHHAGWWFDVHDRESKYSYTRSTEATRELAIREALEAVEAIHLDVN
jgi:hypothetical protein